MVGAILLVLAAAAGLGAEPSPGADAASAHFETRVRPLLVEHCLRCHGPEKQKGGLRLDTADSLRDGGESGPILVPGKPEESLLVQAIQYASDLKMPPKGKLSDAEVAAVAAWVRDGAVWPGVEAAAQPQLAEEPPEGASGARFSAEQKAFWAFQPIRAAAPAQDENSDWAKSPIDRLVLAGLKARGLKPAPPADKRTLIRRATFDLIGLPPTPAEIASFLSDDSPDAFARVIDRLLASSRHGERWGRHWLDLARYADSNGMDENVAYANAWRYRDYVVASFNDDKPFDQFLKEQIAGDLLSAEDDETRHQQITGTGFLVLGPKMLAEDDPMKMEMDIIDEQVDTVGRVFLGLTVGCARCHDHKFDPIPASDYYGLAGIFKSTRSMANHKVVAMWHEQPLANAEQRASLEKHKGLVSKKEATLKQATAKAKAALKREVRKRAGDYLLAARDARRVSPTPKPSANERDLNPKLLERWRQRLDGDEFGPGSRLGTWIEGESASAATFQRAFDRAADADNAALAGDPILDALRKLIDDPDGPFSLPRKVEELFAPKTASELARMAEEITALQDQAATIPEVMSVEDQSASDLRVHIRGSHLTLGELAPRHFPRILAGEDQKPIGSDRSGRLELAEWLVSPGHPLTARVMANRLWQWHFGQGLVRTPDNFGRLGQPPTHPELLDWLAHQFIARGWSMKTMHRLIMMSSAYQMSGHRDEVAAESDPENQARWRFDRRRLEAEEVRDAILAVSGEIDGAMGGTRLTTKNHAYVRTTGAGQKAALYDVNLRSVYLPVIRSGVYSVFQAFDFADPSTSNGQRMPTTVAPQALFMLNDTLMLRASAAWANRLLVQCELDDAGRVRLAYETAYGRPPDDHEVHRVLDYLTRVDELLAAEGVSKADRPARAWQAICQAILAASEFITID